MSNTDTLSHEANEMHAGAAAYDERRAVLEEMNEGREAMDEARGNDGVRVPGWEA